MKGVLSRIPPAQAVVIFFLLAMVVAAVTLGLPVPGLLGDSLVRVAMNGVLVLSLVPMLRAGVGMNYGLPLCVLPGLLGMVLALELRMTGLVGLAVAVIFSVALAVPVGLGYAWLLRRVRSNEEVVGTFAGFSAVYLAAILWGTAPFTNPQMLWPIGGKGLRPQTNLTEWFGHVLDSLGSFTVLGVRVPTGTLLVVLFVAVCLLVYQRTLKGRAAVIAAENERFARVSGTDVERLKSVAVVASTVIAAVGIVLYAHTYGFLQLYDAPLMMAFPAAAAILVGGYMRGARASASHALLGALLFNAILVFSTPIANELLISELSDITRVLVTNGVILYAMVRGSRREQPERADS